MFNLHGVPITMILKVVEAFRLARRAALSSFARQGTPARHRRGHLAGDAPGNFATVRMLRRAIARGYRPTIKPDVSAHDWSRRPKAAKS